MDTKPAQFTDSLKVVSTSQLVEVPDPAPGATRHSTFFYLSKLTELLMYALGTGDTGAVDGVASETVTVRQWPGWRKGERCGGVSEERARARACGGTRLGESWAQPGGQNSCNR